MKKLFALIALIVITTINAQAPQGFNYQATVRNSSGELLINQIVLVKFNILQNSDAGTIVYSENQTANTDDLGHIALVVGHGTATTGTFSNINWGSGTYFLGIELNTGTGYVAMGATQLLSVPYALYANSAGSTSNSNNGNIFPTVTTNQVTNVTGVSAYFSASITNANLNQLSTSAGFVYSAHPNPIFDMASSNSGNVLAVTLNSNDFSIDSSTVGWSPFLPNTLYFIRAFVITENNTIIYGNEVSFTTSNIILNEEFYVSPNNWNIYSALGPQVWSFSSTFGNPSGMMKISGYASGNQNNEDWLISPVQHLSLMTNATLSFDNAYKFTGNPIEVLISNNYPGTGNPLDAGITWTTLTATLSAGNYIWTSSGSIDISSFTGVGNESVYIAFKYTSTTTAASTWEIDNVKITSN